VQPTQNLGHFKISPWTMVVSRQSSTRWRNWCETPTSPCVYSCQFRHSIHSFDSSLCYA